MSDITIVQSAVSSDINDTATFGSGLTEGNTLLIVAADYGSGFTATAPTQFEIGSTEYTAPASFLTKVSAGTSSIAGSAWLVPITAPMAGATNLNFTEIGSGPLKLYGVELASDKPIVVDQAVTATDTVVATFDTGTATTNGNDELAFVFVAGFNSYPTSGIGSPWTQIGTSSEMQLWYQNDVANGTALDLSGSMSATADWISGIITLKTGLTVTATSDTTFPGMFLQVEVLTNADVAGTPATVVDPAMNAAITTTEAGSYVLGALYDWNNQTTWTAESGCTVLAEHQDATNSPATYGAFRTSSGTGTPGSTTVGVTDNDDNGYGMAAVEIIPSGGSIGFDASSPSAAVAESAEAVTTAAFSPPPGSLLVAIAVSASGDGADNTTHAITMSDTMGLTWTQQVVKNDSVVGFTAVEGVWTARVPGIVVIQEAWFTSGTSGDFDNPVTEGSSIVLVPLSYDSGTVTFSNPEYNGSTPSGTSQVLYSADSAGAVSGAGYLMPNVAGGHTSVSVDCAGTGYAMRAFELGGLGSAPQLDSGGGTSINSATSGPEAATGATPALVGSPAFVCGFGIGYSLSQTKAGSPWNELPVINTDPGGFSVVGYQIVDSPGSTYNYEITTTSDGYWANGVFAITPGAAGVPGGESAYETAVLADNPIAYWKLDEDSGSSTAADSSGNGWTGAASGTTFGEASIPSGMTDTSVEFSGLGSSEITTSLDTTGYTAFTFEAWVNPAATQENGYPSVAGTDATTYINNDGWFLNLNTPDGQSSPTFPQCWIGNGTTGNDVTAPSSIPAESWTYLAVTYDGSTITLYVNGASVDTASLSGAISTGAFDVMLANAQNAYTGLMSHAAVYDTALSSARVSAHYVAAGQFTPNGSPIFADGDFSLTPVAIGDLILVQVINEDNTVVATSLSSSNATWTPFGTSLIDTTQGATAQVFAGKVTSLSADTVTIGWGGTAPTDIRVSGQEFTSVDGTWALDQQGSIDTEGTNTWASLTPAGPGELYWGFAVDSGTASSGSTAGYTYVVGPHHNGMLYNPGCSGATQAPVWDDSGQEFGIMVLVKTSTGTSATANGVTATSASAAPAGSVLARAKAVGVTAASASAAPAGSVLARAKAVGVTAASASAAPAGSVLARAKAVGVTAVSASAASAGSVLARAKAVGVTATSASSAPIGHAGVSVTANGVTAHSASAAPAGHAGVSATANGVTATSASAAPAGHAGVSATANGVTATSVSSAPTGAATAGGAAVATGVTATSVSSAPAGSVKARAMVVGVTATSASTALAGSAKARATANGVTAHSASTAAAGYATGTSTTPPVQAGIIKIVRLSPGKIAISRIV